MEANLFTPAFVPTDEQLGILSAFKGGESLKIHAFAGTGKTATLTYLAGATDKRGLYFAFNRRVASEAQGKMPPNVEVRTVHSLAWRWAAPMYTVDKLKMRPAHNQVFSEMEIPAQLRRIYHRVTVNLVLKTVENFCQSGDEEITEEHLPWYGEDPHPLDRDAKLIRANGKYFLETASRIWQKMKDANEAEIPLGHDGYLKLWSLSNPRIVRDFLFVDEAQDLNPVMLKILDCYSGQKIIVGDGQQQIYLWRGAVNAMEHAFNARDLYLTQTFRFGKELADMANSVLRLLDVTKEIVSAGNAETRVVVDTETDIAPNAYLFRTNVSILEIALSLFREKKKYHIVDPNGHILTLVEDYFRLNDGLWAKNQIFLGYNSWEDVVKDAAEKAVDHPLVIYVRLFTTNDPQEILQSVEQSEAKESNQYPSISTVHQAKGLEWDAVQLGADIMGGGFFKNEDESEKEKEAREETFRVLYVALTRAKKTLIVPEAILNFCRPPSPAGREGA